MTLVEVHPAKKFVFTFDVVMNYRKYGSELIIGIFPEVACQIC